MGMMREGLGSGYDNSFDISSSSSHRLSSLHRLELGWQLSVCQYPLVVLGVVPGGISLFELVEERVNTHPQLPGER